HPWLALESMLLRNSRRVTELSVLKFVSNILFFTAFGLRAHPSGRLRETSIAGNLGCAYWQHQG
ncbi:hypothetical protein, partial [Shewanella algae]|uniref:hypothetical protein n=1 Tax=Shewanella algae TaxID=38313 RepID=UPI003007CCC1